METLYLETATSIVAIPDPDAIKISTEDLK